MTGFSKKLFLTPVMCLMLVARATAATGDDELHLKALPDHIDAGTLYRGAKVHITATVPSGCDAVVKIEGQDSEVELNRKGKLAVIWLNVARIVVKNAPQVYILAASKELTDICSQKERENLGLGFDVLRERMTFSSEKTLTGLEFGEFLKLKQHNGTYNAKTQIKLGPANNGRQKLSAILSIAAAVPPGEYTVWLYCFEQGNLTEHATVGLSIKKVGLPLYTSVLAYNHAAAYGIIAIIVAMATGIVCTRLKPALEKTGYAVKTFTDSLQAKELLEHEQFDIVVTDLKMANIDGMQLYRFAKEKWPRTQVIIISGFATVDVTRAALQAGVRDVIAKPFRISQLKDLINEIAGEISRSEEK
jgi:uncharacterized protein (TIGR02186 family)